MRYWLIGLFCTGLITGCNSEDGVPAINQNTDKTSTESIDKTPVETIDVKTDVEDINFSKISCNDDLTTVLALINKQRSQLQMCGGKSYGPAKELTWSVTLTSAAQEHSDNMANYNFFSHTGIDQSSISTRVTSQGYNWSFVAENIAAGQTNAQSVVDAWMKSDGHCKNIMSANVTEMGLACSQNFDANYPYYWTQVFAKPR